MHDSRSQFDKGGRRFHISKVYDDIVDDDREAFKKYKTVALDLLLASTGGKEVNQVLALIDWSSIRGWLVYECVWVTLDDSERERIDTLGACAYMKKELRWSESKVLRVCAEAYISEMEMIFKCSLPS